MSYLLSQIKKGNVPTKDELLDVFEELPMKYYKEVALALLEVPRMAPKQDLVEALTDGRKIDTGLATVAVPKPQVQQKPRRQAPKVDPNKAMTPGDLKKGSNVLGNS